MNVNVASKLNITQNPTAYVATSRGLRKWRSIGATSDPARRAPTNRRPAGSHARIASAPATFNAPIATKLHRQLRQKPPAEAADHRARDIRRRRRTRARVPLLVDIRDDHRENSRREDAL